MARNAIPVIDGDGHVMEDWDALLQYMPEPYIKSGRFKGRIFPPLDHLHSASLFQLVPGAFRQVREDGWLEFMEDVGSDFPHEVNNEYCKHEIEEIIENEHLTDEDKHAVLHGNAERFYGLKPLG
jgi:hypothetical protein